MRTSGERTGYQAISDGPGVKIHPAADGREPFQAPEGREGLGDGGEPFQAPGGRSWKRTLPGTGREGVVGVRATNSGWNGRVDWNVWRRTKNVRE